GRELADAVANAPGEVAGAGSEAALALAASAAALADTPRRAAERRERAQAPAVARGREARPDASPAVPPGRPPDRASVDVALASMSAAEPPAAAATNDPFPMPPAGATRPWPRSLLPSAGGYTVSGGGLAPRAPVFEPFLPATPQALPW